MNFAVRSNLVKKETLRKMQAKVLAQLSESLINSFGPMGSHSCIKFEKANNKYSKDGHTILTSINFDDVISESIRQDIEEITRYITITVGDGTTSAVVLSNIIFNQFVKYESDHPEIMPYELVSAFKNAVSTIMAKIKENAQISNVNDIYNIAMISTNGNKDISENIKQIYEEYGMNVFIDVAISNSVDNLIKIYNGMVLKAGFADLAYTNLPGKCSIRNAKIYAFDDPVDTPEMMSFVDAILSHNIIEPWNAGKVESLVPTVILAPKISRDLSAYMTKLAEMMIKIDAPMRPPLLIVANIHQKDDYIDIMRLCGATPIRKYIDSAIQSSDIEKGLAPTPTTLVTTDDFCGFADEVVSDNVTTKFVNPKNMYKEDGVEYSDIYNGMIEFLEGALNKAKAEGEDVNTIGNYKRRINSLKANMVEYLVGGISTSDRDSLRDLVEDAVKNCRSAASNGFGYGANFEGLMVTHEMSNMINCTSDINTDITRIIAESYKELMRALYRTVLPTEELVNTELNISIKNKCPLNIRSKMYDDKVLSSIESDVIILDSISKIVSLMFTCNQFIVPRAGFNLYEDFNNIDNVSNIDIIRE